MGSQHTETRQLQQTQLAELIEKRTAVLSAQGKTPADIAKDAHLKKLKGDLRRTRAAIASIAKLATTVADARTRKTANAEKRAAERPKKKRAGSDSAAQAESEKKKKKEKKKQ